MKISTDISRDELQKMIFEAVTSSVRSAMELNFLAAIRPKDDRILTINEASEYLRLTKATLYKKSCLRQIPSLKVGKRLMFSRQKLDEWVMRLSTKSDYLNQNQAK
jgi:excisionase family DNA binding protein